MLICSSSQTHTSLKFIGFGFRFNQFWISCQKHRYTIFMRIGFYPYTLCFKYSFNIMFFIHMSFGENVFPFQSLVFEKYGFCLKAKFQYHKNGSNSLQYVLIFGHTCLLFKDLKRTYFCEIYVYL